MPIWTLIVFCAGSDVLFGATIQNSQEPDESESPGRQVFPPTQAPDEETPPTIKIFGATSIKLPSDDGRYSLHLCFRDQFRYTYPFDDAPATAEGFGQPARSSIDVRRARIKLKGNIYRNWINYHFEHDFANNQLLDLRFTPSRYRWLQLRVGQWKVNYNRERADSSEKQQFVDRSIANGYFTLDRQPGVMVAGRLWPGPRADSWYLVGVFNGNGRGASNDDASMMWMARYQWTFLGRDCLTPRPMSSTRRSRPPRWHSRPRGIGVPIRGSRARPEASSTVSKTA